MPISEIAKMPEHKIIEEEHKTNYGSFGQELFVRTHHTPDGIVRKIAGVSLPYPLEVRREDVIDIMKLATSAEDVEVKGWDGLKKGKIESFAIDRNNGLNSGLEIKRFIAASRIILGERYGKTSEERTDDMNKYFGLLDTIWNFSDEVVRDVDNILNNPNNTNWQAFHERYFQKGIILIEGRQANGVVLGNPPFGGDPIPIIDVAIDEPHKLWLKDGYIAEVDSTEGDKIIANCEDTETVLDCRGSRGCSEFFDIMETGLTSVISESTISHLSNSGFTTSSSSEGYTVIVDILGRVFNICNECRKEKGSCNGHKEDKKDKN